MNQNPDHRALEALTEETARQILSTCQPGTTSDPLHAVKHLLYRYLHQAQQPLAQELLREAYDNKEAQHTWEHEGGARMPNDGPTTL